MWVVLLDPYLKEAWTQAEGWLCFSRNQLAKTLMAPSMKADG